MKNNNLLGSEQAAQLRAKKLLSDAEVAYIAGDLIVAENVTTGDKRVIGEVNVVLSEGNRRVLQG